MAPHHAARLRLFALGEAVFLHVAVVVAVAVYALRLVSDNVYAAYSPPVLAGWLGLSVVPALVMAPVFGVLAGSRWNWWVQLVGTLFLLGLVLLAVAGVAIPWLSLAGAAALESAAFGIAVLGNVSAVCRSTRLRVPPVVVFLALAAGGGALLGVVGGLNLAGPHDPAPLANACAIATGAALVAVLVGRYYPPTAKLAAGIMRPFAAGATDVGRTRLARAAVIGLWFWGFLLALFVIAVLRVEVSAGFERFRFEQQFVNPDVHPDDLMLNRLRAFGWAFLGGILLTAPARYPLRHGGFALLGATAGAGCTLWLAFGGDGLGPVVGLGLSFGASLTALLALAFTWTRPSHHGVAAALVVVGWCAGGLALAAVLLAQSPNPVEARLPLVTTLVVVTGVAALGAWLTLFRPALELTAEFVLWPVYRVTGRGPGYAAMPARGPYLVIANHAAWLDPLFLAKVVQAPIVPMMTSKFYDLPVISFLMRGDRDDPRPGLGLPSRGPGVEGSRSRRWTAGKR